MTFAFTGRYPARRPRRMRRDDFSRRLMREHRLTADDLIYPVFVIDGASREEPVASMPGVSRNSIDRLLHDAESCVELGVPAIALFPVIPRIRRPTTPRGVASRRPRAARGARAEEAFPELGVITDVALDPYTTHGQDGLIDARRLCAQRRDRTALVKQALVHARGRRRHRRAVGHDGRAHRRDPRGARRRRLTSTRASSRIRPNTRRVSTARSATPSARRRTLGGRQQVHLPDGPGEQRRSAVGGRPRPRRKAPTW